MVLKKSHAGFYKILEGVVKLKEVKLIVTDLDGTFLTDNKQISEYTAEIMNKVKEKGIYTAFAMARPKRSTAKVREMFEPDFIIDNNGATIYFGKICRKSIAIEKEAAREMIKEFQSDGKIKGISIETGRGLLTNYTDNSWDREGWNSNYQDFSKGFDMETPKISFECEDVDIIRKLVERFPDLHMYPNHGEHWIQIMDKSSTKLNGIKYICDEMGIGLEEVICFGNDYNDVEMLKFCGVGVAVENALDEAKQAADYVCKSNNEDGVAQWIEENILK